MRQDALNERLPLEFDRPLEACPLCLSPGPEPYDRDYREVAISRCGHCGMKFMNPQYTDAYLAKFYSQYIPSDRPFGSGPEFEAMAHQRRVENFAMIEQYVSVGRLLSIGCGDGLELKVAQQRGWNVEGFDVDPATTQRVSRTLNVPIHTGDLCQLGLPAESYDCVYLDQVIEHPKRPRECLQEAYRLLRPGGAMLIGCPNITSIASTTKAFLEWIGIRRRKRGHYYNTEHHLFYYSPGVLRRILEQYYHFKVLRVQGDPLLQKKERAGRLYVFLHRRFPCLESTFQVLAVK
jgi:SAM-dependent methyltransferase